MINSSIYILSPKLLEIVSNFVKNNEFSVKEEYMITDPIGEFVKSGGIMKVTQTSGKYLDGGYLESWLKTNNAVCAEAKD